MAVFFVAGGLGPFLLQLVPLWLLISSALAVCSFFALLFVVLCVQKYLEAQRRYRNQVLNVNLGQRREAGNGSSSPQSIDLSQVLSSAGMETTRWFNKIVIDNLSRVLQHSSFRSEFRPSSWSSTRGRAPSWRTWSQRNAASAGRKKPQKLEDIALKIQKMPTEEYLDPQKLHELKPKELIAALTSAGASLNTRVPREKEELVERLREKILASHTDSSSTSCSICLGEYEHGDILRITPCKHRFHLECIDQWAFSATDFSRPVACPLCNSDL